MNWREFVVVFILAFVCAILAVVALAYADDSLLAVRTAAGGYAFLDPGSFERIAEVAADGAVYIHHEELEAAGSSKEHNLAWAIARLVQCAEGPVPTSCRSR